MGKRLTSLSAGLAIHGCLSEALGARVTGIYPVAAPEDAALPYVTYYRTGVSDNPTKRSNAFDSCTVEVSVYAGGYGESVELAEAVRAALEGNLIIYADDGDGGRRLKVDCGRIADSGEWYMPETYRQDLTIECKIV